MRSVLRPMEPVEPRIEMFCKVRATVGDRERLREGPRPARKLHLTLKEHDNRGLDWVVRRWPLVVGARSFAGLTSESGEKDAVPHHRRGEEQRVDAVEDAAVTREERAGILYARAALDHGFDEVADLGDRVEHGGKHDSVPEHRRAEGGARGRAEGVDASERAGDLRRAEPERGAEGGGGDESGDGALPRLLGADA